MNEKPYTWLSFRDTDEDKNLGVAIVKASTMKTAVEKAHELGINPGGEVLGIKMSEEDMDQVRKDGLQIHKLYTAEDLNKLNFGTRKVSANDLMSGS